MLSRLTRDQVFVLELVEMMREGGVGDVEFLLDLADDQAFGMRLRAGAA